MAGVDVPISRTWRADPSTARAGWRYEGFGWPRRLSSIRWWMVAVWAICGFTIWGYVDIGPRGRLDPGQTERHMTDFTVFTEAGAAFFDGRNPYFVANPRGWHYLYPPLFALLVAPLSAFDTQSQVLFWFSINVALLFGCLFEVRALLRLLSRETVPRPILSICLCAALAAALPFLDCMQSGQLGIAILYFLLLGFRLAAGSRSWPGQLLAGIALALPASIKLMPALPVLFLVSQQWSALILTRSSPRSRGGAASLTTGVVAGALLFLLVIPASLIGWHKNLGYLRLWQTRVVANDRVGRSTNFNIHSERNQSLANAVYLLKKSTIGITPRGSKRKAWGDRAERVVHGEVRVVIGAGLALLLAVGLALCRRTSVLEQAVPYSLACSATLLVSPLSWGHYFMALVPAHLFVPMWLHGRGLPRLARVVALIPPILSWSHYVAMPYTGGVGLLGLGTAAWFLSSCVLILGIEFAWARNPERLATTSPSHPSERVQFAIVGARSNSRAEAIGTAHL
jgi:hypothetical protein